MRLWSMSRASEWHIRPTRWPVYPASLSTPNWGSLPLGLHTRYAFLVIGPSLLMDFWAKWALDRNRPYIYPVNSLRSQMWRIWFYWVYFHVFRSQSFVPLTFYVSLTNLSLLINSIRALIFAFCNGFSCMLFKSIRISMMFRFPSFKEILRFSCWHVETKVSYEPWFLILHATALSMWRLSFHN